MLPFKAKQGEHVLNVGGSLAPKPNVGMLQSLSYC